MKFQAFAFDAKKTFKASTAAEVDFNRALRKVATMAGHIVEANVSGAEIKDNKKMMQQLREYAELIGPWAKRQSEKLLQQVSNANKRAFKNRSAKLAEGMAAVSESNVGAVALSLLFEQVDLIKSLPLEAGLRAQKIAYKNIVEGTRAQPDKAVVDQLINEMGMSTEVAVNRAKLIARTETARANAHFTEARATSVGALKYRWHSTRQSNSRHSHNKMHGKIVFYNNPPTLSDGTTGHAGTFPNCMCWQEPIFED